MNVNKARPSRAWLPDPFARCFVRLAVAVALATTFAGCAPGTYRQGVAAAERKDSAGAIAHFMETIRSHPDYEPAYVALLELFAADPRLREFEIARSVLHAYTARFGGDLGEKEKRWLESTSHTGRTKAQARAGLGAGGRLSCQPVRVTFPNGLHIAL